MSDPSTETPQTPQQLRDYADRQTAAATEAQAEAETLRAENRRLAFQAAGVDLEHPVGKMFDTAYSGEQNVDAIKAAWTEVAPQSAPAPPPADDGPTPAELEAAQARAALTTGGTPPGEEPTAPAWNDALGGFRSDREAGRRVEVAQHHALGKVFTRAAEGDETALFDEARWRAQFG